MDAVKRSRHRREPGGTHDDVEVIALVRHDQTSLGEVLNRRFGYVDQVHVRQVEGFVVAAIHAQALAAKYIVGAQQLRNLGILDDRADLAAQRIPRCCRSIAG